ncbi:MAG: phosphonate ABC transporter, permease protein PhnE [Euryarchaeota archaeon]|nr:phosphonate ABC transporter, permease protein PhnE [Euryarchaeota archaeon]
MKYRLWVIGGLLIIAGWAVLSDIVDENGDGEADWGQLEGGWSNIKIFFEESMWPPDWKILEARSWPPCEEANEFYCSVAYIGMVETIKIAFIATALGFIVALPLSVLSARNLVPIWVAIPFRIVLAATRSLPSIIWAIFFVIIIGFGPLSGVFAMTFYTIGYLGKLQYESIEGMVSGPLEAGRAMGLQRHEIVLGIVIPESSNHLLSQLMFMFEYNVRHGTVVGIVGAGGIGYYINTYLKMLQYQKVFALLIVVFVVVVVIDLLSMLIRSFVNEEGDVKRPGWFGVLLTPAQALKRFHRVGAEEE